MPLNVTSLWTSKIQTTLVNSVIRKFTFNGSEMSAGVLKYGKISHDITDIIGGNLTMEIENADQTLNSFFVAKTQFFQEGSVKFGFPGPAPNSVELITNGGFSDTSSWAAGNGAVLSVVAGGKIDNALKIVITDSDNPFAWQDIAVIEEYQHNFEIYIRSGTEATYRTRIINKNDDSVIYTSGDSESVNNWTTAVVVTSFFVPTNCSTIRAELYLVGVGAVDSGNDIFYDSATLIGPNVVGSEDVVQLFGGELTRVSIKETQANLVFKDKLSRLHERLIGSDEVPVDYTGSSYNPADLAWFIQSSYGGISDVKSDSNPDVDYPTWQSWWQQFDDDSVVVQGYFEGETVLEALEKIAKLTDSVIYDEGDNRLDYERWAGVTSFTHTLTDSYITGRINATIEGDDIINRVNVLINYNPTSDTWGGTVTHENSVSVNSYGLYEETYDDTTVWFVNSLAANNQAQRIVFRRKEPNVRLKIPTTLRYLDAVVGDMVDLTTEVYSMDGKVMTLTGYSIDLDKGTMMLEADEGFGRASGKIQGFILDDAYWGLLDETHNPLY